MFPQGFVLPLKGDYADNIDDLPCPALGTFSVLKNQ
jgi:hypothetical protein